MGGVHSWHPWPGEAPIAHTQPVHVRARPALGPHAAKAAMHLPLL